MLARYRSVVIMGGSGAYPPAGVLREVDANIDHDAVAAALVFGAPRQELVMVGVNVTNPAILDEASVEAIAAADTPQARLASAILPFYLGFYQHKWGRRICCLHDPLAAGILVQPDYVTAWREGPVNVIGDGYLSRAWLMEREDGGPLVAARPGGARHAGRRRGRRRPVPRGLRRAPGQRADAVAARSRRSRRQFGQRSSSSSESSSAAV